jgi:hypothetical protein
VASASHRCATSRRSAMIRAAQRRKRKFMFE